MRGSATASQQDSMVRTYSRLLPFIQQEKIRSEIFRQLTEMGYKDGVVTRLATENDWDEEPAAQVTSSKSSTQSTAASTANDDWDDTEWDDENTTVTQTSVSNQSNAANNKNNAIPPIPTNVRKTHTVSAASLLEDDEWDEDPLPPRTLISSTPPRRMKDNLKRVK